MKTDELVTMLARGDVAVQGRTASKVLAGFAAGTLASAVLMVALLGVRPTLTADLYAPMFWIKGCFCALLAVAGLYAVARAGRPGARLLPALLALAAPVAALWILAAVVLGLAEPAARPGLIYGASARECSLAIVLLSLPAFLAMLGVMRSLAPTRLRLAGALAGLAAGATGAFVYSFHCDELAAPFLAAWYVLGILAPALAGAWIGPRVLRW